MVKSGMTRRIDELGRLVIPKEIRKNLKIKDNDQIEISMVNDKIILSKYELFKKDDTIHCFLQSIRKMINKNILFTNREKIVDYCLINKKKINNFELQNNVVKIIENRNEIIGNDQITIVESLDTNSYIISPLIVNGDLYGSLITYGENEIRNEDKMIINFSRIFLENYLE